MNLSEIVQNVSSFCNVKDDESLARIEDSINERYRQVCKAVGVGPNIVRTTVTAVATIGNRSLVWGTTAAPVTKLLSVYDATVTPVRVLTEVSFDTLRNTVPRTTDPAFEYAIQLMGSRTVTILMDAIPQSAYTLTADVLSIAPKLSGFMIPAFDEDYHDILTFYAKSVEFDRKGNSPQEKKFRQYSEDRLRDMRYQSAVSATMRLVSGESRQRRRWV